MYGGGLGKFEERQKVDEGVFFGNRVRPEKKVCDGRGTIEILSRGAMRFGESMGDGWLPSASVITQETMTVYQTAVGSMTIVGNAVFMRIGHLESFLSHCSVVDPFLAVGMGTNALSTDAVNTRCWVGGWKIEGTCRGSNGEPCTKQAAD